MLSLIKLINLLLLAAFVLSYLYQLFYALIGLLSKRYAGKPEAKEERRYAAVIAARNEEAVIGELIVSLRRQYYPAGKLDIYVVADNCTDRTAEAAAAAGAQVCRRRNPDEVGKGYALDFLFRRLLREHGPGDYAGYFIFDADNLVDAQFVREMNKVFDRGGYDAITCYRNSKNYGDNWISAGYSLWFLRQARFLNFPRSLLGLSCSVGGTGFFVSDRLIREYGGWPFHLLTEDIEFSADCAVRGRPIGYCDRAVVFDEQPTTFRQSWAQRLRWSKGFYQVDGKYGPALLRGIFRGGRAGFSCYDTLMAITPGAMLLAVILAVDLAAVGLYAGQPAALAAPVRLLILRCLFSLVGLYYLFMFLCGLLTVLSEWRRIPAAPMEKLRYLFTFPLFMLTYLPIAVTALFRKVEWKPIVHHRSSETEAKQT